MHRVTFTPRRAFSIHLDSQPDTNAKVEIDSSYAEKARCVHPHGLHFMYQGLFVFLSLNEGWLIGRSSRDEATFQRTVK